MHEECANILRAAPSRAEVGRGADGDAGGKDSENVDGGWLEVGPKQKAAITRSSGAISYGTPITKIFGGKLRSELRVPGLKNSVTLEPYQPLQLDIGANNVNNITDALKGLTRPESLHGEFNSPRGPGTTATKQVFIETLPPVLILHLKRFQYDNAGGTQKIWKRVGYPLELELPREVFPPAKRSSFNAHNGLPRYRLITVVYHHGKNAGVGHYTVDVRRQDGREWIRMDDTIIRRIRSEDVAEGSADGDSAAVAAALEKHKRDGSRAGAGAGAGAGKWANAFEYVGEDGQDDGQQGDEEEDGGGEGWKEVTSGGGDASPTSNKKRGAAAETASAGKRTPLEKTSLRDNKVAYILFYERIKQ